MRALRDALRRWLIPELADVLAAHERLKASERERALRLHLDSALGSKIRPSRDRL